MSRVCDLCGKRPVIGMSVSHAHNRTKKRLMPNLQSVRAKTPSGVKRLKVCTRCIRSGKVVKAG